MISFLVSKYNLKFQLKKLEKYKEETKNFLEQKREKWNKIENMENLEILALRNLLNKIKNNKNNRNEKIDILPKYIKQNDNDIIHSSEQISSSFLVLKDGTENYFNIDKSTSIKKIREDTKSLEDLTSLGNKYKTILII